MARLMAVGEATEARKRPRCAQGGAAARHEPQYYEAYSHIGIHEEMIRDRSRTDAYRDAIVNNSQYLQGKTIMDVGAGTGILAWFCIQAGARRVYAVEASDIADQARLIVAENGLSDRIIVIKGRVEDAEVPEKVDIILSEWMGYFLLYECMLPSVLTARDRFLKPDGLVLPSTAEIHIAAFSDGAWDSKVEFWRDVYGVDMSAEMPLAKQCCFQVLLPT